MADIKQAAKWMQEGKQVRRPDCDGTISCGEAQGPNRFIAVFENGKRSRDFRLVPFNCEDLLADDWEISEL